MSAWRIVDLGGLAYPDPRARYLVRRPLSRNVELDSLCWGNAACYYRRIHSELCPGAARRRTCAGRDPARIECMNGELCLSCHEIERYLGEDESRVHALRGVSLSLEPGTIHAVVGPSGCGKSTLLYILGLLDPPDAGSVSIESKPMLHLSDNELARKRNEFIGFIFQFHFLMEDFSAQENVMIPMRRLGRWSEEKMLERASALLE